MVSVILPTYNGASRGYLKTAIESVLLQSEQDIELIIVNDGSTDETGQVCMKYSADPRVKYMHQHNKGLAAARNLGIRSARGEYICLIDDDDIWKKDKIKRQIEVFEGSQDQGLGMVYCAVELIDGKGKILGVRYKDAGVDTCHRLLLEGNIVSSPSSVMIKKDVLEKTGIFNEDMKSAEDLELWLRISRRYAIRSMPEDLAQYRLCANSITVNFSDREEFFEYSLYLKLVQEGLVNGLDKNKIFRNLYERTAGRRFSMGDYRKVRKFHRLAASYGSTSFYSKGLFILSWVPFLADIFKTVRRKVKYSLFKSKR